jgi:hypothetical protein
MRNANSQRANTIVRLGVLQQPPGPHVSHAEIGGRSGAVTPIRSRASFHLRTLGSKEHESKIPPVLVRKFS